MEIHIKGTCLTEVNSEKHAGGDCFLSMTLPAHTPPKADSMAEYGTVQPQNTSAAQD